MAQTRRNGRKTTKRPSAPKDHGLPPLTDPLEGKPQPVRSLLLVGGQPTTSGTQEGGGHGNRRAPERRARSPVPSFSGTRLPFSAPALPCCHRAPVPHRTCALD
ncbi:hypothetical protein AAFF_G00388860 [Aldrovandia affinis]|uniref:Uncharacterized protein n=1 Tax=Aldrovandia affinis TaxID=143900 RepID=A0AAD7SE61_9TELE|nr:hypothetical protein AAFF_G00388860 [Aldrovandia affinis]